MIHAFILYSRVYVQHFICNHTKFSMLLYDTFDAFILKNSCFCTTCSIQTYYMLYDILVYFSCLCTASYMMWYLVYLIVVPNFSKFYTNFPNFNIESLKYISPNSVPNIVLRNTTHVNYFHLHDKIYESYY